MKNKIPSNLDEAIAELESKLLPEDRERIKTTDMGEFHFSVGRGLRNDWGLWSGGPLKEWFKSIGIEHADDMSGIILKALRRKICGYPYDLAEDVKHYQAYWKRTGGFDGKAEHAEYKIRTTKNQYGETEIEFI